MDVQRGHCWRCEKVLPEHLVHCDNCPMAEYCTTSCRDTDRARHSSVECQVFGPKKCNTCGKTGDMKECSQCNNTWYCNKECQRRDCAAHKKTCREMRDTIKSCAKEIGTRFRQLKNAERVPVSPHYFGNTLSYDFLKLDGNEWSKEGKTEDFTRDYHVLSAGCGDLRNTVLTAASLPAKYQGNLHITLDDFDAFVMARNVLFLYMLVRFADTEDIESSLSTIWYSLHISKTEYDLIKTSLDELIQMSAQSLHDVTKGLVRVLDTDLRYLRQVWEKWQLLECQRDKSTSINLRKQRKEAFEDDPVTMNTSVPIYLKRLPLEEREIMREWFDHGLFLPIETKQTDMPFDNMTLTGRQSLVYQRGRELLHRSGTCDLTSKPPKDYKFVYCINVHSFPFVAWDCIRVRESTSRSCSSPMVMYHNYVTNILQKMKSLILQERLYVHISLANCLDFPNHHLSLQMPNYDRIFTSNLADYVGFAKLLQTFKPLLNCSNSYSVIVTETMSWFRFIPKADLQDLEGTPESVKCYLSFFSDRGIPPSSSSHVRVGFVNLCDYFYNMSYFLMYMRADIMGGGLGIQPLKDVPSFNTVMTYHGMQMRDFRKKLNRLVPFQYRVNARELNWMHGYDRVIEWNLPHTRTLRSGVAKI